MLAGGGAKLPGIQELFRDELKLSAQIGLPISGFFVASVPGVSDMLESPEYVSVLGLLSWGRELQPSRQGLASGNFLIKFLKSLLP